ncbi:MAG: hypothetical protein JWM16_4470 [Verrucomicrobiales bacterium]|nr:hypothetical protein [Verrucomicrobiales bacterium]
MTCSLEDTLAGDRDLLARAVAWADCPTLGECAGPRMARTAREQGIEFATALLYDRVLRCAGNGAFFQQVKASRRPVVNDPPLIGLIPGAFYLEHKNTGADGAQLAAVLQSMNCRVERVPVESFGSLGRNATIIADWLSRHRRDRVAFITLSKGSADLKIALGLPNAAELFRNVDVWMSLSGLSEGTPLVAWLRRQPWRKLGVGLLLRLRGQRYSVVEELRQEPGGPLTTWPAVPARLRLIHILSFPLRRHLAHPWAARGFDRLAPLGPNDGGGFLLSDKAKLPGTVFPIWGADHYLQPDWDVTALLRRIFVEALSPPADLRQAT